MRIISWGSYDVESDCSVAVSLRQPRSDVSIEPHDRKKRGLPKKKGDEDVGTVHDFKYLITHLFHRVAYIRAQTKSIKSHFIEVLSSLSP